MRCTALGRTCSGVLIVLGIGERLWRAAELPCSPYGEWFFAWEEISASFPELSLYRYRNVDDWEVCPADSGG